MDETWSDVQDVYFKHDHSFCSNADEWPAGRGGQRVQKSKSFAVYYNRGIKIHTHARARAHTHTHTIYNTLIMTDTNGYKLTLTVTGALAKRPYVRTAKQQNKMAQTQI